MSQLQEKQETSIELRTAPQTTTERPYKTDSLKHRVDIIESEINRIKDYSKSEFSNMLGLFKDFDQKMQTTSKKLKLFITPGGNRTTDDEDIKVKSINVKGDIDKILADIEQLRVEIAQLRKNGATQLKPDEYRVLRGKDVSTPTVNITTLTNLEPKNSKQFADQIQSLTSKIEHMRNSSKFDFTNIFGILQDLDQKIQLVIGRLQRIPADMEHPPIDNVSTSVNKTTVHEEVNAILVVVSRLQADILQLRNKQDSLSNSMYFEKDTEENVLSKLEANKATKSFEGNDLNTLKSQVEDILSDIKRMKSSSRSEITNLFGLLSDFDKRMSKMDENLEQTSSSTTQKLSTNSTTNYGNADIKQIMMVVSEVQKEINLLRKKQEAMKNLVNMARPEVCDDLKNVKDQVQSLSSQLEGIKNSSSYELKNMFVILNDLEKKIEMVNDRTRINQESPKVRTFGNHLF